MGLCRILWVKFCDFTESKRVKFATQKARLDFGFCFLCVLNFKISSHIFACSRFCVARNICKIFNII